MKDQVKLGMGGIEEEDFIPEKIQEVILGVCYNTCVLIGIIGFYVLQFLWEYDLYVHGMFATMLWDEFFTYHVLGNLVGWVIGLFMGLLAGHVVGSVSVIAYAIGKVLVLLIRAVANHNIIQVSNGNS